MFALWFGFSFWGGAGAASAFSFEDLLGVGTIALEGRPREAAYGFVLARVEVAEPVEVGAGELQSVENRFSALSFDAPACERREDLLNRDLDCAGILDERHIEDGLGGFA